LVLVVPPPDFANAPEMKANAVSNTTKQSPLIPLLEIMITPVSEVVSRARESAMRARLHSAGVEVKLRSG
jgi:hypothetical protein